MSRKTAKSASPIGKLDHPDLPQAEQIPIDLLKPYPGNARTHDQRQIATLAAAI